jgi:hypothetical protein
LQEQLPARGEPLLPQPEIDQLPAAHVEIERYPDAPTAPQIPLPVTTRADDQPHIDPLAFPTTTHSPRPTITRTISVSR